MRVEFSNTTTLTVRDADGLDPVTVFLQDFGGSGRITVECWGQTWSTYFGAYGSGTLCRFCVECSADYLVGRFEDNTRSQTALRKQRAYLTRIVEAVRAGLREWALPSVPVAERGAA